MNHEAPAHFCEELLVDRVQLSNIFYLYIVEKAKVLQY